MQRSEYKHSPYNFINASTNIDTLGQSRIAGSSQTIKKLQRPGDGVTGNHNILV